MARTRFLSVYILPPLPPLCSLARDRRSVVLTCVLLLLGGVSQVEVSFLHRDWSPTGWRPPPPHLAHEARPDSHTTSAAQTATPVLYYPDEQQWSRAQRKDPVTEPT